VPDAFAVGEGDRAGAGGGHDFNSSRAVSVVAIPAGAIVASGLVSRPIGVPLVPALNLPAQQPQHRLERPPQRHFYHLVQFLWGLNNLWRNDTCLAQKNTRRPVSRRCLQLESLRVDSTSSNGATRACDS
jgi:hypothetical protein